MPEATKEGFEVERDDQGVGWGLDNMDVSLDVYTPVMGGPLTCGQSICILTIDSSGIVLAAFDQRHINSKHWLTPRSNTVTTYLTELIWTPTPYEWP